MLDATNTAREIREQGPHIAVFGIGAIEQHSIHLPVGTDWLCARDLTERVARELDAFLVPALPFSMSQCHGPTAGTVWLKPETLAAVVRDTVSSLHAQGFRQVLIIDCHGGNFVLQAEIRRLNLSHPDLIVLVSPLWMSLPADAQIWETPPGVHAEEKETSYQLYINPEHVKDARIDYQPSVGREFLDYAFMGSISKWGVWGFPSCGTTEKGEVAIKQLVPRLAEWARATFASVEALRAQGGA